MRKNMNTSNISSIPVSFGGTYSINLKKPGDKSFETQETNINRSVLQEMTLGYLMSIAKNGEDVSAQLNQDPDTDEIILDFYTQDNATVEKSMKEVGFSFDKIG